MLAFLSTTFLFKGILAENVASRLLSKGTKLRVIVSFECRPTILQSGGCRLRQRSWSADQLMAERDLGVTNLKTGVRQRLGRLFVLDFGGLHQR